MFSWWAQHSSRRGQSHHHCAGFSQSHKVNHQQAVWLAKILCLKPTSECPNFRCGLTIFQRLFPTELYRFFSVQVCTSNIQKAVEGTKILRSSLTALLSIHHGGTDWSWLYYVFTKSADTATYSPLYPVSAGDEGLCRGGESGGEDEKCHCCQPDSRLQPGRNLSRHQRIIWACLPLTLP